MRIDSIGICFAAKSVLKKDFDRGLIPLKKDITGHKLKRGESTLDHTIPKSKGGTSNIYNYSIMKATDTIPEYAAVAAAFESKGWTLSAD